MANERNNNVVAVNFDRMFSTIGDVVLAMLKMKQPALNDRAAGMCVPLSENEAALILDQLESNCGENFKQKTLNVGHQQPTNIRPAESSALDQWRAPTGNVPCSRLMENLVDSVEFLQQFWRFLLNSTDSMCPSRWLILKNEQRKKMLQVEQQLDETGAQVGHDHLFASLKETFHELCATMNDSLSTKYDHNSTA